MGERRLPEGLQQNVREEALVGILVAVADADMTNTDRFAHAAIQIDSAGLFGELVDLARRRLEACSARSRVIRYTAHCLARFMLERSFGKLLEIATFTHAYNNQPTIDATLARAILHVMSECKKHPSQDPLFFVERSPHD